MSLSPQKVRGFTLIELLVVIAIIALLSSIVLASLSSARDRGRYAGALSQMRQLAIAAEISTGTYTCPGFSSTQPYPCSAPADTKPAGWVGSSAWPKGPCPGWTYEWDNVNVGLPPDNTPVVRIMLKGADGIGRFFYCVQDSSGNDCGVTGVCVGNVCTAPTEIRTYSPRTITCRE